MCNIYNSEFNSIIVYDNYRHSENVENSIKYCEQLFFKLFRIFYLVILNIITSSIEIYTLKVRHYEERSDEVIQSHTCIFWIATKIFDFLAMTSVCVMTNTGVHKKLLSLRGVADDEVIHSYTCTFWIATKIFDFLAMTSVCGMLNIFKSKTLKQCTCQVISYILL